MASLISQSLQSLGGLKQMKPYLCAICQEAFSKALSLQKHMLKAHGLKEDEEEDEEGNEEAGKKEIEDKDERVLEGEEVVEGDTRREEGCCATICTDTIPGHRETLTDFAISESPGERNVVGLPIFATDSEQTVDADQSCAGLVKTNVAKDNYFSAASDSIMDDCGMDKLNCTTTQPDELCLRLQKSQDIVAQAACAADIIDHLLTDMKPICKKGGGAVREITGEEKCMAARGSSNQDLISPRVNFTRAQSNLEPNSSEKIFRFVPIIVERAWTNTKSTPGHASLCGPVCAATNSTGRALRGKKSSSSDKKEKGHDVMVPCRKKSEGDRAETRQMLEKEKHKDILSEGKVPKREKSRSLSEKLRDLQCANQETERMNELVRETTATLKSSERSKQSCLQGEIQLPVQQRTCISPSQPHVTENYMCYMCGEKFPEMDICIEHVKVTHVNDVTDEFAVGSNNGPSRTMEGDGMKQTLTSAVSSTKSGEKSLEDRRQDKNYNNTDHFACSFCPEVCKNKGDMRFHKARNCGKDTHRCVKCAVYSVKPSTKELEDMARAVENARDATDSSDYKQVKGKQLVVQFYQCIVCNDRFAVEKHLREHLKTHVTIACQFCDTVFPSTRELCRHIPVHNRGPLACRTCNQTFFSTYMLLLHMRGHTGNFRCQVCNATFMFQANLPRHMKQKHSNVDDELVEMVCSDSVEGGLSPRRIAKGWTRELNFKCQICGELYCTGATLERHKEQVHNVFKDLGKRQQFVCEICGVVRKSMKRLKSHMICHQVASKRCPHCGKLFVRTCSLKSHIEQIHQGRREFQCQFCGKNLTSQASLVNHERLHTGEQPYECSECGKRFRLGSSYRTHRATEHASERLFICDKCPKRFTTRSLLTKHSKTHLPVGKWTCSLCGKTFKREDLLKSHIVLHRREARCRQCGRQFSNDFALRYHSKKIHNIDLYRSNLPDINPLPNFLSAHQVHGSARLSPQDFKLFTASTNRDSLAVNLVNGSSQDVVDGDPIDVTCPLPTPAALASSELNFDPGRLSDPTNLAITAILSELCKRV